MSKSNSIIERRKAAVAQGVGHVTDVVIERAQGSEIWDVEGRRYVDFATGIAVVNTGHNHPKVVAAVQEQMKKFSHACFHVTMYEEYVELAEKLNKLIPGGTPKKTMFASTGVEAVENAVKIARAHTGRSGVIAFSGGFHGRTMMGMALTGKVVPYKAGFGPFPSEIFHARYPNNFHGISVAEALVSINTLLSSDVDPARVAAVILEPVQGEGGFNIAPPEFLQAIRELCDQHGIVMIVDEIQTGFARTGKMFSHEYAGIEADIVTMAKGIAGGFPISALTGKAEIMDAANPGGLGGTYAGSPIGCAAGLAVLEVIEEEGLVARAQEIGTLFRDILTDVATKPYGNVIGDIRNQGAMIAIELIRDGDVSKPDADMTKAVVAKAREKGLVTLSCGTRGNVIRFLPALTISDDLIREGLTIVDECLKELN
ncbi:4-aminobutyrate--2-oxoglutarate transaminase [Emcibacter sp.]|uniref:4-aminobutyrate--2-oxoglutarate transaminase n=1 Tax=Emcibacter sp. TaxID=1979954 RepID=UPI003A8E1E1C